MQYEVIIDDYILIFWSGSIALIISIFVKWQNFVVKLFFLEVKASTMLKHVSVYSSLLKVSKKCFRK